MTLYKIFIFKPQQKLLGCSVFLIKNVLCTITLQAICREHASDEPTNCSTN